MIQRLELHVLGPGLGLPSLDVECLAAILYLQNALPPQMSSASGGSTASDTNTGETASASSLYTESRAGLHRQSSHSYSQHTHTHTHMGQQQQQHQQCSYQWTLVASTTSFSNPFRQFPALRVISEEVQKEGGGQKHQEDLWVAGYDEIVSYLRDMSYGDIDLDKTLDAVQRADSEAFTAFIRSRGAPLLDLSLFVSSENYTSCTRGALGDVLSWPESWVVPHRMRETARKRSDHLGLSALDVDVAKAQQQKEEDSGLAAHIPKSLRLPKQTVSGILGKTAQHTKFRLDGVTDDFLEPLHDFLGGREGLLGNGFHSVDCLAVAYLMMVAVPELPQGWLKLALNAKYASLGEWARKHGVKEFGTPIAAHQAISGTSAGSHLPWKAASPRTVTQRGSAFLENLVGAIPGLRVGYDANEVVCSHADPSPKEKLLAHVQLRQRQELYSQMVTSVLATTSLVTWLVYAGILTFPGRRSPPSQRSFGDAGLLLGLR